MPVSNRKDHFCIMGKARQPSTSFRLSDSTRKVLDVLSARLRKTKTTVIEMGIERIRQEEIQKHGAKSQQGFPRQ